MSKPLFEPEVPAWLRTGVYFTGLIVGFVVMLIVPVAGIWAPAYAVEIVATATAVSAAFGWLSSALGVIYRPTAHDADYQPRYAADDDE